MAVLSTSNLAPAPAGQTYRAWAAPQWSVGRARPPSGLMLRVAAILIAEAPILATPPDAVQVTLEPRDNGTAPTGPPVISWTGPLSRREGADVGPAMVYWPATTPRRSWPRPDMQCRATEVRRINPADSKASRCSPGRT